MSPFFRLLPLAAALLSIGAVQAATYRFTGPAYNAVTDFIAPCSGGTCANYVPAMSLSGWFTTAAPLAANLLNANIAAQVTAFSFSDGVNIVSSEQPGARIARFQVSTNAGGMVGGDYWIVLQQWQDSLAGPHAVSNRLNSIEVFSGGGGLNFNNLSCSTVGTSVAGVADACTGTALEPSTSNASYPAPGGGSAWTAAVPDISINDVSVNEGNAGTTSLTFTVSLSAAPTASPVTVVWTTANGTATVGSDYVFDSDGLGWAVGDGAPKTITVQVNGDADAEANETFYVNLSSPSGAGFAKAQGTGTVINDDGALSPPDLQLQNFDPLVSSAPGDTVSYSLVCTNIGPQAATGVTLSTSVPANTAFNAAASAAGWTCLPNHNAGSTCTYAVGGLLSFGLAGSWMMTNFAVTVASPLDRAVTQIVNTASCTDDGSHGADPTPANNSATDTNAVTHPPAAEVSIATPGGRVSAVPGTPLRVSGTDVEGTAIEFPSSALNQPIDLYIGTAHYIVTALKNGTRLILRTFAVDGATAVAVTLNEGRIRIRANRPGDAALVLTDWNTRMLSGTSDMEMDVTRAGASLDLVQRRGYIVLPGVNIPRHRAAGGELRIHAKEQASFDVATHRMTRHVLGDETGGSAGDPLTLDLPANLSLATSVPKLDAVAERLGRTVEAAVAATVGATLVAGQSQGVLTLDYLGQGLRVLPLGAVDIDPTRADGVELGADGTALVTSGGVKVRFVPSVGDLGGLARDVAALLPGTTLKLGADGVIVALTADGTRYALRPDWFSRAGMGSAGFATEADGGVSYARSARTYALHPAFADFMALAAAVGEALPGATLKTNPDGTATVGHGGRSWMLAPALALGTAPAGTQRWWAEADGRLMLRNTDGSAQAFRVE